MLLTFWDRNLSAIFYKYEGERGFFMNGGLNTSQSKKMRD